jgi:propionate CoA-transferase
LKNKIVSAEEAIAIVRDGDTVAFSGFVGTGTPDELILTLEKRFLETGSPRDLTLVFAAAPGDGKDRGLNHLAHPGLVKRVIGGHWSLVPKLGALAVSGQIEAYNLPLGVVSHLFREIAAHRAGLLTKVGPAHLRRSPPGRRAHQSAHGRGAGARDGDRRRGVALLQGLPHHVAFIRGTTAIFRQHNHGAEALTLDNLAIATRRKTPAVRDRAGRSAAARRAQSAASFVPGVMVDCVCRQPQNHTRPTAPVQPGLRGEFRCARHRSPMALDERKVIARARLRAAHGRRGEPRHRHARRRGGVANEERVLNYVTLTAEPGVIGGVRNRARFRRAVNTEAVIHQNQQFDFYDGGGLDMACLGMAQCDCEGHVNVSRFGPTPGGAGGFINITQNARHVVFAGHLHGRRPRGGVEDGQLRIVKEGAAASS